MNIEVTLCPRIIKFHLNPDFVKNVPIRKFDDVMQGLHNSFEAELIKAVEKLDIALSNKYQAYSHIEIRE